MRNVTNEVDGIVYNRFGRGYMLDLGRFFEVNEVFVEVQTGCCQQWAGIIVKVRGKALAFFFLGANRCIQQPCLLLIFHLLQSHLVENYFTLMKNDKYNKSNSKR